MAKKIMDKQPLEPADVQSAKRKPGRPRLLEPSADYVARLEEIVTTAAKVFHEKGYDAGTLDDVADALDLRRASLYYYAPSKANLLYMVLERAYDLTFGEFERVAEIEDPADRLEAFIRLAVRTATGEPSMFAVVFDQRHRLEPQYEEKFAVQEAKVLEAFRQTVEAAGAIGAIDVVDAEYATRAIFGMCSWPYKWFQPGEDDAERLADACVALILGRPRKRPPAIAKRKPRRPARSAG
jgi:AcrR family transcriptional regulator